MTRHSVRICWPSRSAWAVRELSFLPSPFLEVLEGLVGVLGEGDGVVATEEVEEKGEVPRGR